MQIGLFKPRFWRNLTLVLGALIALVIASTPSQSQASKTIQPQIVGGTTATPGAWPATARLRINGSHLCGGSLLSTSWVMTAAHCVRGVSINSLSVVLGDHDRTVAEASEQIRSISRVEIHPNYRSSTYDNDIALLQLSSPVTLNSRVATIAMASSGDAAFYEPGDNSTVVGWGTTSEGGALARYLQQVTVPIVSNATCNSALAYNGRVTANMICAGLAAGGKDSCQGDSGGPLMVSVSGTWKVVGIVSWGTGCARPNKYGVYTRVPNYTSWVSSITGL